MAKIIKSNHRSDSMQETMDGIIDLISVIADEGYEVILVEDLVRLNMGYTRNNIDYCIQVLQAEGRVVLMVIRTNRMRTAVMFSRYFDKYRQSKSIPDELIYEKGNKDE